MLAEFRLLVGAPLVVQCISSLVAQVSVSYSVLDSDSGIFEALFSKQGLQHVCLEKGQPFTLFYPKSLFLCLGLCS